MKRILCLAMIALLLMGLLAGCGGSDEPITKEKAQKTVLEDLGVSADEVTMHTHITTYDGIACYSIYVTIQGSTLEYVIHSMTGEILSIAPSSHKH